VRRCCAAFGFGILGARDFAEGEGIVESLNGYIDSTTGRADYTDNSDGVEASTANIRAIPCYP
jgi:hypothetical protein